MSPLTLVRHLKAMKPNGVEMFVKIMRPAEFFDHGTKAEIGCYNKIKYASSKEIAYNSVDCYSVSYKLKMGGPRLAIYVGIHDRG